MTIHSKGSRLKHREAHAAAARQAQLNASQSTAQLIFGFLQSEPTPRDAAATLAAVHAALLWSVEQDDEAKVRTIADEMAETIVALWKAQKAAQVN